MINWPDYDIYKKIHALKGSKKRPLFWRSRRGKQYKKFASSAVFARWYAAIAVCVLLGTTIFWAFLSARLQQVNADQLADPDLFESRTIFNQATFPGSHSFLIKWPVFLLTRAFGLHGGSFEAFTVLSVLATVAALAYCLYRIEHRPVVFGTLCLALASVLLLVPTIPYPGALLPVNMAMLATRNLEYVVFIAALVLLVRARRVRSWQLWAGTILLTLLAASDKLFMTFSVGAAGLALFVYALLGRWQYASKAVKWLFVSFVAALASIALLALINTLGITHIANQQASGPYGLTTSVRGVVLGIVYAIMGLLTNFGANPAFDATIIRNIPTQLGHRLLIPSGISFIINAVVLLFGLVAACRLGYNSLRIAKTSKKEMGHAVQLALALLWTSLTALGVFVLTNHYYAVDARYLTVIVFALFITLAVQGRTHKLKPERMSLVGLILMLGMILAVPFVLRTYWDDRTALVEMRSRNGLIVEALSHHHVDALIGDYWRVLPVKNDNLAMNTTVIPLSGCTQMRDVLASRAWQLPLNHHSFAYLLTLDKSPTDYPQCSLRQVAQEYGRPNASVVIAGNLSNPKELLLFYDHGIHRLHQPPNAPLQVSDLAPVALDSLPDQICNVPTIMNVVAHQDDDLLFLSPDLLHDVQAGHCIRTVYVTAGDAGSDHFYWLNREQGSEAAYSSMLGSSGIWVQHIAKIGEHEYVTIANPAGNGKISLVFMHLPDGNIDGSGFAASRHESLQSLEAGKIPTMQAVDDQSIYSEQDLQSALVNLMHAFQPSEIRTQATYVSNQYPDHSDHMEVSRLAHAARDRYDREQFGGDVSIPIKDYIGYPIHAFPENVSGTDLKQKEVAFLSYAKFDGGVCQSMGQCGQNSVYGLYLRREYQNTD